jgi:hypothetical protein
MSELYKIPNRYRRNNDSFAPAYLKGYEHFFYANLDDTIEDSDFNDWVLSVFDGAGNEVAGSIGTLEQDIISGSDFRFYASFTIPESLPDGFYELIIYNSNTDEVKYISNCIEAISFENIEDYVLLFYRNSSNVFNYNYESVNNYNTVFLPMNVIEQQPEIELTQYVEQTTGRRRNQKTITSKVIKLETFFFDDEANDMMLALSVHDDITINQKVVEVKTAFQIVTNKFNSIEKGEIEFYDQQFSTVKLNE